MSLLPNLSTRPPEARAPVFVAPITAPGVDGGRVEQTDPAGKLENAFVASTLVTGAARAVARALRGRGIDNRFNHKAVAFIPIDHPHQHDPEHHEQNESGVSLFKKAALDPLSQPELSYADGYGRRRGRFRAPPEGIGAAERLIGGGVLMIDSTTAGLDEALSFVWEEQS